MCGLAGIFQAVSAPAGELRAQVEKMTSTIAHRGPDDSGL